MITTVSSANAKKGASWYYGRCTMCLIIALSIVGYGWLLVRLRTIGRDLANDPDLRSYAGLPRTERIFTNTAPLVAENRWWRPAPPGSYEPVEMGAIIFNNQDITWYQVRAVGQAYDREGRPAASVIARCNPSTLEPSQIGVCRGEFVVEAEVLGFFMDVFGEPKRTQDNE